MKPRIFIGSSKESQNIAEAIKSFLKDDFVCEVWNNDFFELGECTYHNLIRKSIVFDYAIFIGGQDDKVIRFSTSTEKYAPRDNVYLEFGLYVGVLSYARCFFVVQENSTIASDLLGINVCYYKNKKDVERVGESIKAKIEKEESLNRIGLLPSTSLAIGYFENFLKPVSKALSELRKVNVNSKIYDVESAEKCLQVLIPRDTKAILRSWSEYVFRKNDIGKTTLDNNIRGLGVNIDFKKLDSENQVRLVDVPQTLTAAYKAVELALAVDYIGNPEILQIAKEKELYNFISTLNNLIESDTYTKQMVVIKIIRGLEL